MTHDPVGELHAVLAAEQEQTSARLVHLLADFDGIVAASEMVALDDEHDPEGATVAFERAQVAALVSQARDHLAQLDLARSRLGDGTYGTCERCGQQITAERLAARPTAGICVRCAAAGAQVPLRR